MASSKSNSVPCNKAPCSCSHASTPNQPYPSKSKQTTDKKKPARKHCYRGKVGKQKRNTPSWLPQRATQLLAIKPLAPFPATQLRISPSLPKASRPPTRKSMRTSTVIVGRCGKQKKKHALMASSKSNSAHYNTPPGSCSHDSAPCNKTPWLLFPRLSSESTLPFRKQAGPPTRKSLHASTVIVGRCGKQKKKHALMATSKSNSAPCNKTPRLLFPRLSSLQ